MDAADADLTAQVAAAAPFTAFLGIEMVSASPHEVRARLPWSEDLCTAGGILHGGALMGLADNVGGFCAFLNLPDGSAGTATIESKTNFFGPMRAGHVHAVSRPLHTPGGERSSSTPSCSTTPASSSHASRRRKPCSELRIAGGVRRRTLTP